MPCDSVHVTQRALLPAIIELHLEHQARNEVRTAYNRRNVR